MLFFLLFSLFFLFGCGLHIDKQEQNETCSVVKDTEIISDLFSAYSKHFQYLIEEVFYSTTTDVCIAKLKVDVGENTIYHRLYDIKNKKILTEYLECYPPMYEEPTQDKDCEERYLAYEKVLETLQGKSFQSQLSFKPWLIRKEHSLFEKEKVKTMLLNASNPILNHLKEKNFTGLANYVENSLLFLPYPTHATNEESISFSSIELETLVSSPKNYTR